MTDKILEPGLGLAVAERTILRLKKDGTRETWADVAIRVSLGNTSLRPSVCVGSDFERINLRKHIASGRILMSGRHLQHGDKNQGLRNLEVFTNCATACTSFLSFYLLLNGSGVGRSYDDSFMIVDWNNAPNLVCVLDKEHKDFKFDDIEDRDNIEKYSENTTEILVVDDSREGWAKAVEHWENLAYDNPYEVKTLILDFSNVRPAGSPIAGMQYRPSSGPVPLIQALMKAQESCRAGYPAWKAAMYVDHYLAECVLVGGARRSARIATKHWRDKDILEFIIIKAKGELWTANNSVAVDKVFWDNVKTDVYTAEVFHALVNSGYETGEPGLINLDKLTTKPKGLDSLSMKKIGNDRISMSKVSNQIMQRVFDVARETECYHIVNPCGEITLSVWGGYCVIGDVVPYHADTLEEAEDAFKATTRALMRVNKMPSIYSQEVARTNRIGVGITGVHEFAWKFFKLGFKDLINPKKSKEFWKAIDRFREAVIKEAYRYADELEVNVPHTMLTIKPAGTTSKLFGLTEGWHLPSKQFYLRWTQFKSTDPLVEKYKEEGYPVKALKKYKGTTIVGFPTITELGKLGLGRKFVTAGQATPEEQYKWLKLGEKHWLGNHYDNQISYTLKYHKNQITCEDFGELLLKHQSEIKCCSVMPHGDEKEMIKIYEYLPEEEISKVKYKRLMNKISNRLKEDVDRVHVDCDTGACPVDFQK